MTELGDALGLVGGVGFFDFAEVGENVAFQEATIGTRGFDFGGVGGGDLKGVEEVLYGWVEGVACGGSRRFGFLLF